MVFPIDQAGTTRPRLLENIGGGVLSFHLKKSGDPLRVKIFRERNALTPISSVFSPLNRSCVEA